MAARDFQIALAAAAKQLSDVYGIAQSQQPEFARANIPYRQILLSAETGVAFVGSDNLVTATKYGVRVEIGATAVEPVSIGPYETGPVKLSDFWAAGTGTLHILGIPF